MLFRVPFDVVSVTLDKLDIALCDEKITLEQYDRQHDEFLHACGWTIDEYAEELDARWDRLWVIE